MCRYFEFTVLPFGLSSAGHIFTKVVRTLVKYWRGLGIPVIVYLYDGWVCDEYDKCKKLSKIVENTLIQSGFVINYEKSCLKPVNRLTWLGFLWNLEQGTIEVLSEKWKVLNV